MTSLPPSSAPPTTSGRVAWSARPVVWSAATLGLLAGLLLSRYMGQTVLAGLFKAAASVGFVGVALSLGARRTRYGTLILCGLVLSWFGDVFLIGSGSTFFLAGLVSFLLAHLAYVAAFVVRGTKPGWLVGGLAAVLPPAWLVLPWLLPHVDPAMKAPVVVYLCVISLMVACSLGAVGAGLPHFAAAGAVLFYVSDLAVVRQVFVVPGSADWLWGLPLYYLAQLLLAWSVSTPRLSRPL